jgi:prepilin-type N-terminal cleavage/methylation domain-containing protein
MSTSAARPRLALVRTPSGFTLVELIVVLLIIGILTSIIVAANLAMRQRAAADVAKAHVFQAVPSLEAYSADHDGYTGATVAVLQADYDAALPATVAISNVTADSYCVQAVYKGQAWRKNGPGQTPENLACP